MYTYIKITLIPFKTQTPFKGYPQLLPLIIKINQYDLKKELR